MLIVRGGASFNQNFKSIHSSVLFGREIQWKFLLQRKDRNFTNLESFVCHCLLEREWCGSEAAPLLPPL